MELFASPMACSLASHITALEAELPVTIHYVDTVNKKTADGQDFYEIAPNGYVPVLRLDSGETLNEGPSVLQYLADRKPEKHLAPPFESFDRYRLIDALNYLATEVHKRIFIALLSPKALQSARDEARDLLEPTLEYIAQRLGGRDTLVGDHFTVADAYLITLLNWFRHVGADLSRFPQIQTYYQKHLARPSVAAAMAEEMAERNRQMAGKPSPSNLGLGKILATHAAAPH